MYEVIHMRYVQDRIWDSLIMNRTFLHGAMRHFSNVINKIYSLFLRFRIKLLYMHNII